MIVIQFPKYLRRLIAFSVNLGIIPVLALGLFASYSASKAIQNKVNQGNMQLLRQASMAVEQSLALIDASVTQLINSPSFNDAIDGPLTQEDFAVYRELSASLSNLPYTRNGMNSVRLVNFRYDWMIDGAGLGKFAGSAWEKQMAAYARLPKTSEWIGAGSDPAGAGDVPAKVSLVKKLPMLSNSSSPLGLLVVDINLNDINVTFARQKELGGFVLLDPSYRKLLDANRMLPGAAAEPDLIAKLQASSAQPAYFETKLNETVGIAHLRSSYNDWIYMSVVSIRDVTREARNIGAITLILCLAILAITSAIALYGTRSMYSPIRKLYEAVKAPGAFDGKHEDELNFIEERIHALRRTGTELQSKLQAYVPQLKEFFVLKLLSGQLHPDELDEKLHALQFPEQWQRICVIAVQIDTLANTPYTERDRELLLFAISNIAGDSIVPGCRLSPVVAEQSQVTVVMSDAGDYEEWKTAIGHAAQQLTSRVKQFLKLKVSVGISRSYRQLKETDHAYREALEALRYRIRLGSGVVLFLDDVVPVEPMTFVYPASLEQALVDAVKMTDERWAAEALREWIAEVRARAVSHGDVQFALGKLLVCLVESVKEGDLPLRSLFGDRSFMDGLADLRSAEETEALFRESVIAPLIRHLEERRRSLDGSITEAVIGQIQREFDTNLTLEACAARMNFHPSYVSKVFKKEMGMSFSDYLAQFRLHMSKSWLKETDMKIQDIAERLKYNSAAAFIRYFRKMEGITPGQYRDKIAGKKQAANGEGGI